MLSIKGAHCVLGFGRMSESMTKVLNQQQLDQSAVVMVVMVVTKATDCLMLNDDKWLRLREICEKVKTNFKIYSSNCINRVCVCVLTVSDLSLAVLTHIHTFQGK